MKQSSDPTTTLVTVTYGDRMHYCAELLRRAFDVEAVSSAIVVSNNSSARLEELESLWGARLRVIRLPENTGSANGYSVGIDAALSAGAEYIWLMDDDNAPTKGALGTLQKELEILSRDLGRERAAVLGFRPDHQSDIAMGVPPSLSIPPRSSFFGFHVSRIPYKIFRRTRWGRPRLAALPQSVVMPYAPYGGLLAHREAYQLIGLPIPSLVLYADDTEYTWRFSQRGGQISLVPAALLEDLEESWNTKEQYKNIFENFLLGKSDFRAYYGARNQAWFDRNCWARSMWMYKINRFTFISILKIYGVRRHARKRLALIEKAIADGEASRLGIHGDYLL